MCVRACSRLCVHACTCVFACVLVSVCVLCLSARVRAYVHE